MSKRKTPSSKEGQDVVNLLTTIDANKKNTSEATSDDQANANNIETTSTKDNQVNTNNVSTGDNVQLKEKDIDTTGNSAQENSDKDKNKTSKDTSISSSSTVDGPIEKGKGRIQIDNSYTQLLGSNPQTVIPGNIIIMS
ncbi:uncharacterized protein MELLADRAFT_113286 [Melampsora larici-populina 98AG31]|uniref:Uncharacterized protein n=1 Tax=Melampsora larici-populina (strain 98AG31 / pathotype 3-4-7) TaxID=747676 RepID=F4S9C8_MELLP|nr:uncharacterized protein MELLADRAFT_113286 [Melampsora larici-populina 98AG31]EGF98753.1 hypothetical protein MELLADRAFT_113286 [Melampsora larici-populina 98AG31]